MAGYTSQHTSPTRQRGTIGNRPQVRDNTGSKLPVPPSRWLLPSSFILHPALLLLLLALVSSTGCSLFTGFQQQLAYNQRFDDFALGWRNYAWSRQAWNEHRAHHCDHPHVDHFGEGFRAGFADVADGGVGCVPVLPPRKYWSWQYQTAEGQAKVNAWFAGYPHGVRAAEEYGVGNWASIQTSGMLDTYYAGPPAFGAAGPGAVPPGAAPPPVGVPGYGQQAPQMPLPQTAERSH